MSLENVVRSFVKNEPDNQDDPLTLAQKQYRRDRLVLEAIQLLVAKVDTLQVTQDEVKFDMGLMD